MAGHAGQMTPVPSLICFHLKHPGPGKIEAWRWRSELQTFMQLSVVAGLEWQDRVGPL